MNSIICRYFVFILLIPNIAFNQDPVSNLTEKIEAMAKIGACYSPSFSPDGKEIAFISNMSGIPQLWKIPSKGGWPIQLTNFDDPISNAIWSPKGNTIAFQLAPGGGMNTQVFALDLETNQIQRITSGGVFTNRLGDWSDDGKYLTYSSNEKNTSGMDCYLYDYDKKTINTTIKNRGLGDIQDFDQRTNQILVSRLASRGSNDLYLIDDSMREKLITTHEGPGTFSGTISPEGTIYVASNLDRDKIAFGKYEDNEIKILVENEEAELQGFVLNNSGSHALLYWNVGGRNEITMYDLENERKVKNLNVPVELSGPGKFSSDDQFYVFTGSGSTEPSNIWLYNVINDRFEKLTESPHPGINLSELVAPELVRFKSFDGLELSGWLYTPHMGSAPYPTVISYHGGPEGQSRPSFNYTFQALLSQGIAVFSPNVRGSSGFGKRFVNLDNGALRVNGVRDIEACYSYIVDSGFADQDKVGIMGGSYGGYMVMAGVTEYPDMFAAAANLFGVVNFITFFQETEPWMAAISKVEYGDPDTEFEMLEYLSPINKVDRVKTPTIVLHGANDTNVPVVEAEQVVMNLKERQVPVEYILFPDEGHGWRKTTNKVTSTVAIVNWFKKYLKG